MYNFSVLLPVLIYLVGMVVLSRVVTAWHRDGAFLEEYYIGGRSMGGLVLAMTTIATFVSASSFIGGPGIAYSTGLSWVLLAMIQVPTAFLTLGILGKKFAILSRRIHAVTVADFLFARYRSKAVVVLSSIAMLIFFVAMMIAQFIGGAVLFQNIAGIPYVLGLAVFALVVILYTAVGGFRAVVLTDTIQALVMVAATVTILAALLKIGGGSAALVNKIAAANPAMTDVYTTAQPKILSYWVLVGLGLLGLPQTTVRAMGFRNTKALHSSMIIGTVVVGFLMLGMHLSGFYAAGVLTGAPETSDSVIPMVVMQILPGSWAGVFLAGPLAAIMSTVSSLLILASASIVKDLLLRLRPAEKPELTQRTLRRVSLLVTVALGVITFVLTLDPPDLIVWVNLFAMGGLEAAFFWPTVLGLFWPRANAAGALAGTIGGMGLYLLLGILNVSVNGIHNIIWGLLGSLILFVIFTYCGKKPDAEIKTLFFG